jgi:hypothetical protein
MKDFVNYRKRSIQLPKGCKDISDLLQFSKKSQHGAKSFPKSIRDTKCKYCGGQACTGGTDIWALMCTGVQKLKFMCMPCSTEHSRFFHQQMQQAASGLSQQEQLVLLRKLDRDTDKHMKLWVSERDSR